MPSNKKIKPQYYPIRIQHRDSLWEFAYDAMLALFNKRTLEVMEKWRPLLKLSALHFGLGWGEIAAESGRWMGYYFIIPEDGECRVEHLWVAPECLDSEMVGLILDRAIKSVRDAFFYDVVVAKIEIEFESIFTLRGFQRVGESQSPIEGDTPLVKMRIKI